ncbi:universal stress protein [Amycolatopsis sp. K13G38]|uniref:Universal stress protein n=2 Tax=Amycolatopsis acididurans TaxID=2724524 RepID=A0ABX1IXL1_9PSEU|nr:universal stress protein [Amycolatopsis acididurans]
MAAAVVVGIDGTPASVRAVRWGAREAALRHAPLTIIHAFGIPDAFYGEAMPPGTWLRSRQQASQALLEEAAVAATSAHLGLAVRTESSVDAPIPMLLQRSREARMLVLGSAERGVLGDLLSGSVIGALSGHVECPLLVVRGDDSQPADAPVVVGVDGSPANAPAVALAFEEASLRGVPLVAVHSWSDADSEQVFSAARAEFDFEPLRDTENRVLAEALAGWCERYPDVAVSRVLAKDRPRHQLLEWCDKAGLVVVGSRGRGGFRGLLLGSTTYALVHHSSCPVLVVPSR